MGDRSEAQRRMLQFFSYLHRSSDGSQFFAEGVRCHFATTNYDFVIETILDNIIGPDDSLFLYTYHGFTPVKTAGRPNPVITQNHWLTAHLLKLNGGFEILRNGDRYELDYGRRKRSAIIDKPPVLMLPSREQDYSDPYFRTIFPKAVRLMRETLVLVLVGYSLPDDDALMRFILRQFAEEPEDGRDKYIFYVDPSPQDKKLKKLEAVFPSISQLGVPKVVTFEGGFSDFARECMSVVPRNQLHTFDN
jgi:SIR2-like domain